MTSGPGFADWLAISEVKARYCRCLDTKDWDGYAACFTQDVVIDTAASGGPRWVGRQAALSGIRAAIGEAITTHHVHTPEIVIDGDTASAVWAMQDRNLWPGGRKLLGFGHYHERYRREDGEWKIAESRLTRLSMELSEDS